MNKFSKCLFAATCAVILFTSCIKTNDPAPDNDPTPNDPTPDETETFKFGIWTQSSSSNNTSHFILGTNSLTEGSVNLKDNGIEVTSTLNNSVIIHDGYYYFYNSTDGHFGKYQLTDGAVSTVKEVPLNHLASLAGHTWINDKTLVIIGTNAEANGINYSIIDANTLSIKNGSVSGLPELRKGYRYRVGGDIQYKDGKLFFSVVTQYIATSQLYPRTNILAVSYPEFVVTYTSADTHTVGVGSPSGEFATSFVDEQGDMYFLSSWNGKWRDAGLASPRIVYRVKAGSDEYDNRYFIKVKEQLEYEAADLFMNLGGGKAIIKYEKDPGDNNTKYGYAIFNLSTGKEERILTEIPYGGAGERNVYVEDGKAYIAVISGGDTNYIWVYDSKTDQVTKGLQIKGSYNSFSRIDKLE